MSEYVIWSGGGEFEFLRFASGRLCAFALNPDNVDSAKRTTIIYNSLLPAHDGATAEKNPFRQSVNPNKKQKHMAAKAKAKKPAAKKAAPKKKSAGKKK